MENQVDQEVRYFFKISSGVTLQATESEFSRNWKTYVESRGETWTKEPITEVE